VHSPTWGSDAFFPNDFGGLVVFAAVSGTAGKLTSDL